MLIMLHPARRDGGSDGINKAALFHIPTVPFGMTADPSHDATYDEVHLECEFPELNSEVEGAKNSTCYKKSKNTKPAAVSDTYFQFHG